MKRKNHKDTKSTKNITIEFFVLFVSLWLILGSGTKLARISTETLKNSLSNLSKEDRKYGPNQS
jgi:hypothetical protein